MLTPIKNSTTTIVLLITKVIPMIQIIGTLTGFVMLFYIWKANTIAGFVFLCAFSAVLEATETEEERKDRERRNREEVTKLQKRYYQERLWDDRD